MFGRPEYSDATTYSGGTTIQSEISRAAVKRHPRVSPHRYNKLSGMVKSLANKIKELDPKDPYRNEVTTQLLEKLYSVGLIPTRKSLSLCEKVNTSHFCRRRLPVVMVKLHMTQRVGDASKFVEQGRILSSLRVDNFKLPKCVF
jgi:ribosomal protein S4